MNDRVDPAHRQFRAIELEAAIGEPRNASANPTMGEIISRRFSRRGFLKGALAVSAISATVSPLALLAADKAKAAGTSAFSFTELEAGVDADHHVAEGYDADVLLRWGDPLFPDSPAFDPTAQSPTSSAGSSATTTTMSATFPLDGSAEHGLLVVNHEYTDAHLMFPGIVTIVEKEGKKVIETAPLTKEQVDIEMAAHGGTVVEIRKVDGKWQVVTDSPYNRRITADTEMEITGPAAGHDRLKTSADASGTKVLGTINNCAGGVTPWGTYVTAEENFHGYFSGELPADHPEATNLQALRRAGGRLRVGELITTASTSARSRTSRTASAGSSRSTPWTRTRRRRSARRSAASSTRAPS